MNIITEEYKERMIDKFKEIGFTEFDTTRHSTIAYINRRGIDTADLKVYMHSLSNLRFTFLYGMEWKSISIDYEKLMTLTPLDIENLLQKTKDFSNHKKFLKAELRNLEKRLYEEIKL